MFYEVTQRYNVVTRIRIKDVLDRINEFQTLWFIEQDNDEPNTIKSCMSYLETRHPQQKIWILKHDIDLGNFTKEEENNNEFLS